MTNRRSLPRSYLFVPASRAERVPKAFDAGADAVIVDLEDAVAPADKDAARDALVAALDATRPVVVRINGPGSPCFERDVAACRHAGVSAVMLPKAESAADVRALHERCGVPVLALIETAEGVWNALEIARAPGVSRLAFGALDFRLDLGLPDAGYEPLRSYRDRLVLASRVAGLAPPIDSPTPTFDVAEVVRSEALAARQAGFGGKLCIHPSQVPIVNACFRPSPEEVAWARRVTDAARAAAGAAVAVDGRMVDRPVLELAARILEQDAGD
jgi:citrate lyase subunit beta/citryl-CoA lyase